MKAQSKVRRSPRALTRLALALTLACWVAAVPSAGGAVPAGFEDTIFTKVSGPTALAFTPDRRLLITSKFGTVRVYKNGALLTTPAIDLAGKLCSEKERGLLGMAVDPQFATNHHIYLYYTYKNAGSCEFGRADRPVNRVSRFTLPDSNVISPSSEHVLIDNVPSPDGIHNAGDLQFGKDGNLYISIGDGGCDYAGDSLCGSYNDAARDSHILLGKILRITPGGGIPADNPYRGADSARCNLTGRTTPGKQCQETYASGLRNPFRIAFDPNAAGTRFFVNDVGQNMWEEIDLGRAGADYGWNVREGHCVRGSSTDCGPPPAGLTNPIYDYSHAGACDAITGGAFVPNGIWPAAYDGSYLFGDFTCGKIQKLVATGLGYVASDFVTNLGYQSAVVMVFGPYISTRALYYTTYDGGGEVHRVVFTGQANRNPVARASANPTAGALPLTVAFDGSRSSDPDGNPLSYDWDFGDGSAHATTARPSHTYSTAATRIARLTVRDGRGGSDTAAIRIDAGNQPPLPKIELPTTAKRFRVGERIVLRGSAFDVEDGALGDGALLWEVRRRHNTHFHPWLDPTPGNNIGFNAPAPEDIDATENSYLEVLLTATDSKGRATTIRRDLRPHRVDVTFRTAPSGLKLEVNGKTITAPSTIASWEGYDLQVKAPFQRNGAGKWWSFSSWSDGGAANHTIRTGATAASYTATFKEARCGAGVGTGILLLGVGMVLAKCRRLPRRRPRRAG